MALPHYIIFVRMLHFYLLFSICYCRNVYTEPSLLPTCPELHSKGTITADGARLDIVATGLYRKNEKTFMDVRINHPNAPSNLSIPVEKLLLKNEAEKSMLQG